MPIFYGELGGDVLAVQRPQSQQTVDVAGCCQRRRALQCSKVRQCQLSHFLPRLLPAKSHRQHIQYVRSAQTEHCVVVCISGCACLLRQLEGDSQVPVQLHASIESD